MKRLKLNLALSMLVFVVVSYAQNLDTKFDQILTEQFPSNGPGAAALVAKNGEVIYRKAFGQANLELNVPMQPENIFRIGSITKQFTACAILRLVEQGKLSLQDDITKYIENYPTHGHTITIEHLLTHTSGIKSYTGLEKWTSEERKRDFTPEEMVDYFKNEPMDFAPGERFLYNNSGYFLLGYIIEKVSGKTYPEYIDEQFFKPLGMKNSIYGNTAKVISNRAAGYQKENDDYENADFLSMTQPYAAGSLLSTVDDLHKWYEAVMNYQVISKEYLDKAHTSYQLNNGEPTGYGYGWSLGYIGNSPTIEHGGGINGYLTASMYLPDENVFVAVFSNCNCNPPGEVAAKIAALTIGINLDKKEIQMAENELRSYEAVYESNTGEQRIITFEEGQLYSMRTGGSKFNIMPFDKDKFYFETSFTTLEFIRNDLGQIVSVVSSGRNQPIIWKRTTKQIPKKEAIILNKETLEKYTGKYELAPEFILQITQEDQKLFGQATGQNKIELVPFETNKFYVKSIDAQVIFKLDEMGKVTSLTLLQNGEHEAKKIE